MKEMIGAEQINWEKLCEIKGLMIDAMKASSAEKTKATLKKMIKQMNKMIIMH